MSYIQLLLKTQRIKIKKHNIIITNNYIQLIVNDNNNKDIFLFDLDYKLFIRQ